MSHMFADCKKRNATLDSELQTIVARPGDEQQEESNKRIVLERRRSDRTSLYS